MSEVKYPYKFDRLKRKKARLYSKQKFYTGFIQGTILTLSTLIILYFSGLSELMEILAFDLLSYLLLNNYWLGGVIFVLLFTTVIYLIGLPVSYYSGFILEHRYGLSNQSKGDWIKEQVKAFLIMQLIGIPLILGIFYLGQNYTDLWWLYAGIVYFSILGVLSNTSHLIFLPLFYDLNEVQDEELSRRLTEIAESNGVDEVEKIMEVKAGKKTKKANAGFAGMGKTKRIFLFDTLLENFHEKEIETVVAHEMGHYVNKDILRFILIQGLLIFPMFYLTGVIFNLYASFENFYSLPLFILIIYGLYSFVDPFILAYSRSRERKADDFALSVIDDPKAAVSAFKRLSDIDLAELDPNRVIELLFYSHPPPIQRIQKAEKYEGE
ncbi:MAG: M48 family metallopeptidase [Candidatus Saliniplasma sp.]